MATDSLDSSPELDTWTTIGHHDDTEALAVSVHRALTTLDGIDEETVVFDYVDLEAAERLFESGGRQGGTELRFDCRDHEIKITGDGTIASRRL